MDARDQDIITSAAEVIAGQRQLWTRLLDDHVPGPDGRCTGCRSAVRLAPLAPCRIALLAVAAARHADALPASRARWT